MILLRSKVIRENPNNFLEMSQKSKMPMDWAIADSAIRLSVDCLADICTKLEVENPLLRLGKALGIFPWELRELRTVFSSAYNFESTKQSTTTLSTVALGRAWSLRIRC
jgi:hypothetical protein